MNAEMIFNTTKLSKEDTRELNNIAGKNKKQYGEFISTCAKHNTNPYWWALPLASRNNYHDLTYQNICLLLLCVEKIQINHIKEVITDNRSVYCDLRNYCKKNSLVVKIKYANNSKTKEKKTLFSVIGQLVNEIRRVEAIKKCVGDKNIPTNYEHVIFIPVPNSCLKNDEFCDLYFGDMDKIVNRKIVYCPTLSYYGMKDWDKIIHILEKDQTHEFIYKEQYQKKRDYLKVLIYCLFCVRLTGVSYRFHEFDISHIIQASLINGIDNTASWEAVLTNSSLKRMHDCGLNIKRFIIWYEGRPCDIMLAKTLHTFFGGTKSIGYVGFPIGEINDCLSPTDEQINQKAFPDYITVPGEAYREQINQFSNHIESLVIPITRNDYYAYDENKQDSDTKKILIAMSYFEDLNYQMIKLIDLFVSRQEEKYDVIVKNHPVFSQKKIEDYYDKKLSFSPTYADGKLTDCLKLCDIAITTKSTATMEVVCSNVFLLIYSPLGDILDTALPQSLSHDYYEVVYDYEDLEEGLTDKYQRYLTHVKNKFDKQSYFSEINKANVDVMFQI